MGMASTGDTWRLGHRPALDGLRGVAVLLVLASHLALPGASVSAAVGVVVFFTLSGFLITTLLLERPTSLTGFYLRRARRLIPALLACIVLAVGLQLLVAGRVNEPLLLLGALTYTSNWIQGFGAYSQDGSLSHLWSLAVEEQFYLLWPIALLALTRLPRRSMLRGIAAAAAASLLLRCLYTRWNTAGWNHAYHDLETRADQLLIGCALAFWMQGRQEERLPGWVAAPALAGIVAMSWSMDPWTTLLVPSVVAALTAVVLHVCVNGDHGWLAPKWLVWVGQRSYGIYLYHLPLAWAMEHQFGPPWWVTATTVLVGTLVLAAVSWRHIEQPALRARATTAWTDTERDDKVSA